MGHATRVIADSVSPAGHRLTTFEATFPRIVLAEFNTHRVFSRNSASSRAIPVEKMIAMAENDPYVPTKWGKNQKGMQAYEQLSPQAAALAEEQWLRARDAAVAVVKRTQMPDIDLHKQTANRLLEPFLWHTVVVTSTEWDNWDHLRDHHAAHPEIQRLAHDMRVARSASVPKHLPSNGWHLPYVTEADFAEVRSVEELSEEESVDLLKKASIGRCAAVSYMRQNVHQMRADTERCDKMLAGGHMSPFEHVARPMTELELECYRRDRVTLKSGKVWNDVRLPGIAYLRTKVGGTVQPTTWNDLFLADDPVVSVSHTHFCGNFNGWIQARKEIPGEWDVLKREEEETGIVA